MSPGINSTLTPAAAASDAARIDFVIRAALSGVRTSIPVRVESCTNAGGVAGVGTVDVTPLVNMLDGQGKSIPHGIIHGLPYCRMQAGGSAVIIDPVPGDIGLISVCDRDISTVKASSVQSAPGSLRKHDLSDAVYLMTVISAAPSQYIQFLPGGGINIHSPGAVAITSSALTHNGVNVDATHVHGGVSIGGASTGVPS